ncbi:hypothetical protein U1Q18_032876 [Sarracenia purpurea var. burkii]
MRHRRFGGDAKIVSPRRISHDGREYSPPRRRSGYIASPIRASIQIPDYSRDFDDGSPTQASVQGRESRDYSQPHHGLRDIHSHLFPGSSSVSSEMEKSRRVLSGERPIGSMERSDYSRHFDGDRDGQLRELSQFSKGLPQRNSPSMKFQWNHLLDEPKSINGNANQSSKHFPGYGTSISCTRVSTEKNYHGGRFPDMSHSGMRAEKSMPMETERNRNNMRSYIDIDGHGVLLPSQKLNSSFHKDDEDLRFQDHLSGDKLPANIQSARELYKEAELPKFYSREEKLRFYSNDTSHYVMSPSHLKASNNVPFGSSMDDFHLRSNGLKSSSGMLTEPIAHEAYTNISHLNTSMDINMHLEDTINYSQAQLSANEVSRKGLTYPEVKRSEKSEMDAQSDRLYGKMPSGGYGHGNSFGPRILEPIIERIVVTECSSGEHLVEGRIWDHHHSSQEQQISNYRESTRSSYASEKYGEGLGHRSLHLEHERDVYRSHGDLYLTEDHGYGRESGLQSDKKRLNMWMTESDPGLDGVYNNHPDGYSGEELELLQQPKKMLKTKQNEQNHISSIETIRKISGKIHDSESNTSLLNASRYRNSGRTFNDMIGHRNSNSVGFHKPSVFKPRHSKSSVSDVKKRLGPVRSVPWRAHNPHPSVKKYKLQKYLRINQDDYRENIRAEEESHSNGNLLSEKSEPPENSEDFKQLVQNAFFKFLKQLNENPAQRRRFKEEGKAGSLKCSVCGRYGCDVCCCFSDSKEFLDTEGLVMHACTDPRIGCRARHLGFHKALCSLMCWKSSEILTTHWVRELLPDSETASLKEDLIIWPPVVVVHNDSIRNIDPDARVVVSIGALEGILRDLGFGKKTKVCRGKPANQSIMVVRFTGTFSGLQEAEKLHKFYADNKHGRAELQQINASDCSIGNGKAQKASANTMENCLYGYLGIADDLDKLDFETKKWCSVRSKKGIQEMADAPLKTE